jgi:hypothetical protein
LPGVLTGAILAVSRGAGEVAPVLFTGAAYFLPYLPSRLTDQFMELGYHVFILSTQSPDVEKTKPLLYGTVLVLLGLTFALNVVAVLIRARGDDSERDSEARGRKLHSRRREDSADEVRRDQSPRGGAGSCRGTYVRASRDLLSCESSS